MKLRLPQTLIAALMATGLSLGTQVSATDYTATCSTNAAIHLNTGGTLASASSGDTVTITATAGYLDGSGATSTGGSETIAAALTINNFILTNGWQNITHLFTGAISGDSTAQFRVASRASASLTGYICAQTLTFQGDLSNYKGTIGQGRSSTVDATYSGLTLNFAGTGATNSVVATIENANGTTNVNSNTTFTGSSLAFGNLTVATDKTMTITGGSAETPIVWNIAKTVANNGTVSLGGVMTIDVNGMTPTSVSNEVKVTGTTNGYSTGDCTYTLYKGNAFTLADGAAITVKKGSQTAVSNYDGSQTVTVTNTTTANYYIKDGETFSWDNASDAVQVTVDSTVDLGGSSHAVSYVINDGATATSSFGGGAGFFSGTAVVNAGGTLSLTAGDALGWGNGSSTLSLIGSSEKTANMIVKNRLTTAMTIDLQGYTSVTLATGYGSDAGFDMFGGIIKASRTNNTIATNITTRSNGNATIQVLENGELTVTGKIYGRDGAKVVNKTGDGKLIVDGDESSFAAGLSIQAGTVDVTAAGVTATTVAVASGSALTVSGKGNDMTVSGVVSGDGSVKVTNSGKVTLNGENTYTGGTTLASGTVVASTSSALGTGNVAVEDSGVGAITADGVTLTIGGRLNMGSASKVTLTGKIAVTGLVDASSSNKKTSTVAISGSSEVSLGNNLWLAQDSQVTIAHGSKLTESLTGFTYTGNNGTTDGTIAAASSAGEIEVVRNDSGTGYGHNANKVNTVLTNLDVTYAGTSAYTFEGSINSGSVTTNAGAGTLTLNRDGLSLTNLTANSTAAEDGTVTASNVIIDNNTSVTGTTTVASGSKVSVSGTSTATLAAVTGTGTIENVGTGAVTINGDVSNTTIAGGSSDNGIYIGKDSISDISDIKVSGNVTLGDIRNDSTGTSGSAITGDGATNLTAAGYVYLTSTSEAEPNENAGIDLNANSNIKVKEGAQLYFSSLGSGSSAADKASLEVESGALAYQDVAGNVVAKSITNKGTAYFSGDIKTQNLTNSGSSYAYMSIGAGLDVSGTVTVSDGSELDIGSVAITNTTDATATIEGGLSVTQDTSTNTVTVTGDTTDHDTTVNNAIINLSNATKLQLTDVTLATTASITDNAKAEVMLSDVTINGGSTTISNVTFTGGSVTLGTQDTHESYTLTSSNVKVTSGSILNANLSVSGAMTFGGKLTMGCDLSIADDTTITLTGNGMASTITGGGKVALVDFSGTPGTITVGNNVSIADHSDWQLEVINNTLYATPEPATTTLSLLALAGLCARRRRH